jgi:GAF domain-containing protein
VVGRRRLRILALLTGAAPALGARRLCEVSAEVTASSGAGIMLMTGDGPRGSVCTTNQVSDLIEQLQYTLGEGPCVDAHHQDRPVLEADLADPVVSRWRAFTGPALDAGVRAVFGFPLRVGAVRLGALNLYRDRPSRLTDDQHADALVMADVAAEVILLLQSDAAPGQLAAELEAGADLHDEVHQASGMVAAQLGISLGDALVRLRAHAFAKDQPLADVARRIVARTLRLDSSMP